MTSLRKDLAATVLAVLTVAAYATAHEGWNVWLIGDNHRWATGAVVLLGLGVFAVVGSMRTIAKSALAVVGMVAVALAAVALATGSLTPLSLLVATIAVVWLSAVLPEVRHTTHHRATPAGRHVA